MNIFDVCDTILNHCLTNEDYKYSVYYFHRKAVATDTAEYSTAIKQLVRDGYLISTLPPETPLNLNHYNITAIGIAFIESGGYKAQHEKEKLIENEKREEKELAKQMNHSVIETNNSVQTTNESIEKINQATVYNYRLQKWGLVFTCIISLVAVLFSGIAAFKEDTIYIIKDKALPIDSISTIH